MLWRVTAAALLCVLMVILRAAPAEAAISSRFPDADSVSLVGGNFDAYASVTEPGNYDDPPGTTWFIGRDTPSLQFKVFYQLAGPGAPANPTFNVSLVRACNVSEGVFTRGNADMTAGVYRVNGATGEIGAMVEQKNNSGAGCNGENMDFVIQRSDITLVPSRYGTQWGVVIIKADKFGTPGANSFQVHSTDLLGRVTFTEQLPAAVASPVAPSTDTATAIWDNPNWPSEREYSFEFKPDCAYDTNYDDVYLRWFDADMDQIDHDVEFTIEMFENGNPVPLLSTTINRSSAPINIGDTGPASYRQMRLPVATATQYYRWTWRHVTGLNGLQFWMPFSEMNQFITCPAAPSTVSCEAIITTPSIAPGTNFGVTFRINNGTASSVTNANQWELGADHASAGTGAGTSNYMAPDAANWVRAPVNWGAVGSIPAGGVGEWNTIFSARFPQLAGGNHTGPAGPYAGNLPPGTYDFQWRVIENNTSWLGTTCNATLTVVAAPMVVGCNVNVTPGNPSAGQQVSITGIITNTAPGNSSPVTNADYDMIISANNGVRPPVSVDFDSDPGTPGNQDVPVGSNGTQTVTGTAMGGVGTFTASVTIVQPSGPNVVCSNPYNVAAKPYVKFFGSDVNAGGSFNTTAGDGSTVPCDIPGGYNGTSIKTFAVNDRVIGSYHGSSVEFAAFSMGPIEGDSSPAQNDAERGFFSASIRSAGWEGLYLTFANTPGDYAVSQRWSATTWGGDYSAVPRCIEDYYNTTRLPTVLDRNAANLNLDSNAPGNGILNTGQYQTTNPGRRIELRNGAALFNNRVTLYVDGDLFIRDNINYNTDFTTGIPYLSIIAKGNIYIANTVTNVDGLLIAQPTDNAGVIEGGRVYTCAKTAGPDFEPPTSAELAAGFCNQKLTIHGAVIAQQIRFLRTNGSLNGSSAGELVTGPNSAEVIDMTPEFYAGIPLFAPRTGSNSGAQTYHAIQSLPPVF